MTKDRLAFCLILLAFFSLAINSLNAVDEDGFDNYVINDYDPKNTDQGRNNNEYGNIMIQMDEDGNGQWKTVNPEGKTVYYGPIIEYKVYGTLTRPMENPPGDHFIGEFFPEEDHGNDDGSPGPNSGPNPETIHFHTPGTGKGNPKVYNKYTLTNTTNDVE